jgi:hypothetical protein
LKLATPNSLAKAVEETPCETAAAEAVEQALEDATWNKADRTITLYDPDDDRMRSVARNRDELIQHLENIATNAYVAHAPDSDSRCFAWLYVEPALEPLEEKLEKFFGIEGEEGEAPNETPPAPA